MKASRMRLASALVLGVLLLTVVFGAILGRAAESPGGYQLIKTVSFGTAPGTTEYFDYVNFDAGSRRVFMCEGTRFVVTDAGAKMIGSIGGLKRCHGVAFVPELNRGFITDGVAAQVVIFNLKTLQVIGIIKGEDDADDILYEPVSKRLFVFNGNPHSITVIDPAKAAVIATIPVDGVPEQPVTDGRGMIYDNISTADEVIALDARDLKIKSRWDVAPCGHPTAMAMDGAHRRLFISGRDPKLLVMMDADSGKIIGPGLPIGDVVDGTIFDPKTGVIAASTREGKLDVFHEDSPDKISVLEMVETQFGARTMALDPKTHELYLTTSDFGPAPAPTAQQPNPQRVATPGTFRLLIYGR